MSIILNEQANQFELNVAGGVAFLRYEIGGRSIQLLYVEVPPQSRGQGIAGKLTQAALDFAHERGLTVVPICGYVRAYLRRNPDGVAQS